MAHLGLGFAASGLAASQLWPSRAQAADGLSSQAQVQQEPRGLGEQQTLTGETYQGVSTEHSLQKELLALSHADIS